MSDQSRTIHIDEPPEMELILSGLGRVAVRERGRSLDREIGWRVQRSVVVNYRGFTNTVLAMSVHPCVKPGIVDGLPEVSRRRLMLSVLRLRDAEHYWKALYGSSLSFDERFFAAMFWSWTDARDRLVRRLRELHRGHAKHEPHVVAPSIQSVQAAMLGSGSFPALGVSRSLMAAFASVESAQRMLGLSSSVRMFTSPSQLTVESAFGGSLIKALGEPYRKRTFGLQHVIGGPTARGGLRALTGGAVGVGSERRAPPPGFASVLRPYASNPYSGFGGSESFRSALAPFLQESFATPTRALITGLLGREPEGVAATFGISDLMTKAMRASAILGTAKIRSGTFSALSQEAFRNVATARLGQQLTAGLGGPLVDDWSRRLFGTGVVQSRFPILRDGPAFATAAGFRDFLAPIREVSETLAETAEFMRMWEDDPLWFLLSVFGMRAARRFAGLTRDQVEQALLEALAAVVTDREFVSALRKALHDAPYLTSNQRAWLDHGLEHAADGDWVQAIPQMLLGLEGALHRAAVGTALVVERSGKFMAAEKLVKGMAMSDDYSSFVVRRVFGGIGNAFRHGRADSGERDQVLFAIVALAGWVDYFLELNAMGVLADELSARLDDVIEQVTDVAAQMAGRL